MADNTKEINLATANFENNERALKVRPIPGARYSMSAYNSIRREFPNPESWHSAKEEILQIERKPYQDDEVFENQQILNWYRFLQDYLFENALTPDVCTETLATLLRIDEIGNAIEWDLLAEGIKQCDECGYGESTKPIKKYVIKNSKRIVRDETPDSIGPNYADADKALTILESR